MNDLISLQCEKYCIGGIIKHPELFPKIDSWITENTFGQSTHRVIWGVLKQMLLKGESPTPTLIAQRISNLNIKTKDDISIFDYLNAISFSQITSKGTEESFKELVKLKVLRDLIQSSEKAQKFISENKSKELKEIISGVDAINNEKIVSLYKNIDEDVKNIFDDIEPMIEGLGNNPPDPDSFIMGAFSTVNKLYGSLNKPGNVTIIGARTGVGKAQPIWSKVMTSNGWKKIGDINIGDLISGSDGEEKKVIGVFPQGKREIYKVSFDDGTFTFCCNEHLWAVSSRSKRKIGIKDIEIKSLNEIRQCIIIGKKKKRYNYFIPLIQPIKFNQQKLPLHPYLLGFLLGDGFLGRGIYFRKQEMDIVKKVSECLPLTDILSLHGKAKLQWYIKRKIRSAEPSDTLKIIDTLGLKGKDCFNKFIPKIYLHSSIDQRIELLRGLIDTDATALKYGVRFSTVSEQLSNDITYLARGLGAKCYQRGQYYISKNQSKQYCYLVEIVFPYNSKIIPISSNKHLSKFKGTKQIWGKSLVSVEKVFDKEECVCISVKDSLYITDGFNITHNTSFSMYHQVWTAEKYNLPLLWLDFGEMSPRELQFRSICMLTQGKVPHWAIETGEWRKNKEWTLIVRNQWDRVKQIKFYYHDISNMNGIEIISFIRRFSYNKIGRGNPFITVYDYFKPFDTHDFNKPEWKQMGHFLQDIKSFIVNELPIPIWGAIQLNRLGITTNKTSDQIDDSENAIGLSDRITQQSSHALILRFKTMDEIAIEDNRFGNMKLFAVKHRHLGRDFMSAIKPVKIGKKFMKNHINLEGGSFYYEDRGDLNQAAAVMKEQYELLENGGKDETL